jgi:hypothetical protein
MRTLKEYCKFEGINYKKLIKLTAAGKVRPTSWSYIDTTGGDVLLKSECERYLRKLTYRYNMG